SFVPVPWFCHRPSVIKIPWTYADSLGRFGRRDCMLFGPCAQDAAASFVPAASSLCAGGAGFVTAMMATLAANARAAPARTLGHAVPEVERLAVRMITGNIVIQFFESETRQDLSIERPARANLAPDRPPRSALNGEWGLAMHAESQRGGETRHVMIDFGYTSEVLLNNMAILKIEPACFDALVLSHGHYDHFGGMVGFLNATKGKLKSDIPFYVGGEDCFCIRR